MEVTQNQDSSEWSGSFSDSDIIELCSRGELITENFEERCIKQCCYELRASDTYFNLSGAEHPEKNTVGAGEYILIKPHQNVVIITMESLRLDHDVLGRVLSKGKLFSIGLLPINTYADPGFDGKLGIVFHNSSHDYIKICPKETIAKIEFSRLHQKVSRPYHGQHGYNTQIWPVPVDMILSSRDVRRDPRIGSDLDEIKMAYGRPIADIVEKVGYIQRRVIFSAIIFFSLMFLLLVKISETDGSGIYWSIIIGLLSNCIFAGLAHWWTNVKPNQSNK